MWADVGVSFAQARRMTDRHREQAHSYSLEWMHSTRDWPAHTKSNSKIKRSQPSAAPTGSTHYKQNCKQHHRGAAVPLNRMSVSSTAALDLQGPVGRLRGWIPERRNPEPQRAGRTLGPRPLVPLGRLPKGLAVKAKPPAATPEATDKHPKPQEPGQPRGRQGQKLKQHRPRRESHHAAKTPDHNQSTAHADHN